jgi:hypothetical protein
LLVIPQPKHILPGIGSFAWQHDSSWRLQGSENDLRLCRSVSNLLASGRESYVKCDAGYCLQVGSGPMANIPANTNHYSWFTNSEGYRISVTSNGIVLQASTAQGAFYGLQTLGQLVTSSQGQLSCPAVEIEDWPSLRFRGAHWFPSASGVPMHQRLINNVFSTLKFNSCVIECEAARWDSHPEIAMPNSISKTNLRQIVEDCRARFIEPIPLVNVPGHAQWMFEHNQNSDLLEDPQVRAACCVKNPKTIQFLADVMTECIDVFHPKSFHIGSDEIGQHGLFPNPQCPYCRGETTTSLIAQNANRLADWLSIRGISTVMWGDMLLAPGDADNAANAKSLDEARQRRALLTKNITIADWHYWHANRHTLDVFQQDGFHTIASTFSQPEDVFRFSQAAIACGSDGLLQTTWCGFFPDESGMQAAMEQYAAFVLAAEYSWSGRSDPPEKLGYQARKIFLQAYAEKFGRGRVFN